MQAWNDMCILLFLYVSSLVQELVDGGWLTTIPFCQSFPRLLTVVCYYTYSGKLSKEKTFANWGQIWFTWIARFYRAKGHPALDFMEKLSQIATKPWNSWKFSPSKVFFYTVSESNTAEISHCIWKEKSANSSLFVQVLCHVGWLFLYKCL